jgi:lactoylglutathione lyase
MGFGALLHSDKDGVRLVSRNGNNRSGMGAFWRAKRRKPSSECTPRDSGRLGYAEGSKAIYVQRRFSGSRLPEVPGKYPASLDKKCAAFAQAYGARNCRGLPFTQTFADWQTKGASCNSERAERLALGLGSLGDSLPQGELLSWHTNPLRVAARWLLHFVRRNGTTEALRLALVSTALGCTRDSAEDTMQGTKFRYAIKLVADMDKAVKFYRDVLGLKVKFESAGWSEFVTGETTLAKNPAGKVELGFKGVLFSMPPKKQDFGGVLAQFVDSEGARCSVGAEPA